jgi:hypothetical protein
VPLTLLPLTVSPPARAQAQSLGFWVAVGLVSVPVFFQAPLVRAFPVLSLVMTIFWLGLSYGLRLRKETALLGSILFGFTLSWWCGSLYWGWLRSEPFWHLPVEALGFPIAWVARRHFRAGFAFYCGSFLGTALTDLYIWAVNLTPQWIEVMKDETPQAMGPVMGDALAQMATPLGYLWAVAVSAALLAMGLWALKTRSLTGHVWAGAVLSTLAVGVIFWGTAMIYAGVQG